MYKCVPADPKCQYSVRNMCKLLGGHWKWYSRIWRQFVVHKNNNISMQICVIGSPWTPVSLVTRNIFSNMLMTYNETVKHMLRVKSKKGLMSSRLQIFNMKYQCFYRKPTGALCESTMFSVHWTIYTYFKWNIDILDQLEHIYTYF